MKKTICSLLAALLALFALCGCGGEKENTLVTLRTLSIMGDPAEKEAYTKLLESFSADKPDVYHIGTVTEKAYAYKLSATFAETYTQSKYPHVVYYYTDTGIGELSDKFVSVEEIRESYPDFASGISDAAFESVRSEDGKVYCVPFAGRWTALAVNTELFLESGTDIPEDFGDLLIATVELSARGIIPVANSADDSAALLELLAVSSGGGQGIDGALFGQADESDAWLGAFKQYEKLSQYSAFPPAAYTDGIAEYVSPSDLFAPALGEDRELSRQTDSIGLFNEGKAAMLVLDMEDASRISLDSFELIPFPTSGINAESDEYYFIGGFNTGYFLTRRAFEDARVRDIAVGFIDYMTGGEACDSFEALDYLSPESGESRARREQERQKSEQAEEAGQTEAEAAVRDRANLTIPESCVFVSSRRTAASSLRFSDIEKITAALSWGIITPQTALEMMLDSSIALDDVAQGSGADSGSEQTASPSDAPVSPSDTN